MENRVDVILERCHLADGMSPGEVDLTAFAPPDGVPAWVPVAGQVKAATREENPFPAIADVWSARLEAPTEPGALRVGIREVARIGVDVFPPIPDSPAATAGELEERVLSTDCVVLPPAPVRAEHSSTRRDPGLVNCGGAR